jgi:tetratricopeptide (TPR) repeat protein
VRLLLLLLLATPAAAQLERGNQLYEAGDFVAAAEAYKASPRVDSATVRYNLGNTYYRIQQPGALARSIAAYWRAYDIQPRDSDIRHNFEFALSRSGEELVPSGTPRALFNLYRLLSRDELVAITMLGMWITLVLGAILLLRESLQERLKPLLIASLSVLLLFGAWWGLRSATGMKNPAVVLVQDAEVRSGPGTTFPVSFKVPEGRRVERLSIKGPWVEIGVLKEGLKGWIASSDLVGVQ